MDRVQSSSLRMYVAVASTLQAVPDSLGVASLPAKLQVFLAQIAQIYELAARQTQTTRGKTARRDELLLEMIDLALDVAGAVAAHADEHELTELACAVEVTAGTFRRLRIPHQPILAQQIHDAAQSVVADLAPNGVTAATLAELQAQIDLVNAWLDQPRSVIRAKAAATAQLAAVFRATDALLKRQIDRLVFRARRTHPEFYADYQRARQVPDLPGARGTRAEPEPLPEAPRAASAAASVDAAPTTTPPQAPAVFPEPGKVGRALGVTETEADEQDGDNGPAREMVVCDLPAEDSGGQDAGVARGVIDRVDQVPREVQGPAAGDCVIGHTRGSPHVREAERPWPALGETRRGRRVPTYHRGLGGASPGSGPPAPLRPATAADISAAGS